MRRFWLLAAFLWGLVPVGAELPVPGDPRALVDLRWMSRPTVGERFIVDTLSGRDATTAGEGVQVVADVPGPGVVDHLMFAPGGEVVMELDGEEIFRGNPHEAWRSVYVAPRPEERGELPWAFPLVHRTPGAYANCALPLPFRQSFRLTATGDEPRVWVTGRRLGEDPTWTFSAEPDSPYMTSLREVQHHLLQDADVFADYPPSHRHPVELHCPAGAEGVLANLSGPGEMVGLRLRFTPGALDLLRYQVVELTVDGVTSLRMPLVDLLGASHPWPWAWFYGAGTRLAGLLNGYTNREGVIRLYLKLPVAYRESLRVSLQNRSPGLPVTFQGDLQIMPLDERDGSPGRLCGTSPRVAMPVEAGVVRLLGFTEPGRLVSFSMFTVGHGPDWDWRRRNYAELVLGEEVLASGAGLLPLGQQGITASGPFLSPFWNHNSLEATGRAGAGRGFWTDPLELPAGSELRYAVLGEDSPRLAEVGVLWYQTPGAAAFAAPPISEDVVPVPTVHRVMPHARDGWDTEAEALADTAVATAGEARAATEYAVDLQASGGAYLAWNAERPGDTLDLLVPLPPTRYAKVALHRLAVPAGGVFDVWLVPLDEPAPRLRPAVTSDDILRRVLGGSTSPASIDFYGPWLFRQAGPFEMPIMLSPNPGGAGKLRFVCVSKPLQSRGYRLALDQVAIDPAPPTPEGWHEMESVGVVSQAGDVTCRLMPWGRSDFYAWGGLELASRGTAEVVLGLLRPTPAPVGGRLRLRGLIDQGEWTVELAGREPQALTAGAGGEPVVWEVPLPELPPGPVALEVRLRCSSRDGKLLLDAWSLADQAQED